MKIKDVMATDVLTVSPDTEAVEAAKTMERQNVGCIVVADSGKVTGVLTDRDLLIRSHTDGNCFTGHAVSEFMTSPVITVTPDEDVLSAIHTMNENSVRRLPVEQDGKLIGIVSWADLASALDRPLHDLVTGQSKMRTMAARD